MKGRNFAFGSFIRNSSFLNFAPFLDVTPAPRTMFFFLYALFIFSSIQNVKCARTKDLPNEIYQELQPAAFRFKRNDNGHGENYNASLQKPKADKLISNSALRDDYHQMATQDGAQPKFQAPEWMKPDLMERQVIAKPLNSDVSQILYEDVFLSAP